MTQRSTLTNAQRLDIVARAWGKQEGYVFFPLIDRQAQQRSGSRTAGYEEGPAFQWPQDRAKILRRMRDTADAGHDLYWCPNIFEFDSRRTEFAMDEHALWADLDAVDPRGIEEEYRPTVAWETSPGRYQALWVVYDQFDMLGASWPGNENQRLTRHLQADQSGWDSTQLLRIPQWPNHKLDYVKSNGGIPPEGQLLWSNGRKYYPNDFEDLPEIDAGLVVVEDILEDQIDGVDRDDVWGRVRLKVSKRVREFMQAKEVSGDRSDVLWEIERELADSGCSAVEIVALIRPLVWNKYAGRHDEMKRLVLEAQKAVAARPEEVELDLAEAAAEKGSFTNIFLLIQNVKPPAWVVDNIWAEGSCGFVAGQPKSWKSWIALDLMLSLASGRPFLNRFNIQRARPVAYVQEEDSLPMLQDRLTKVWPSKQSPTLAMVDGEVWMEPPPETIRAESLPLDALVRGGFTLTDDVWQHWLAAELERKRAETEGGYGMLVLDPLMMVAGEVDENRAQDMTTKIFKPLKQLAEEYKIAVCIVNHMRKSDPTRPARGGQLMLGSVANHAWSEDSLYVTHAGRGFVRVEKESKHGQGHEFFVAGLDVRGWDPTVMDDKPPTAAQQRKNNALRSSTRGGDSSVPARSSGRPHLMPKVVQAIAELGAGWHTTPEIADHLTISRQAAGSQLRRAAQRDHIIQSGLGWSAK